jgi:TonB family protein
MRHSSLVVLAAFACGRAAPPPSATATAPAEEPPVALNAEPAVQYPPDLYDRRVEGDVVLRLFADSTGRLAPESTRVAESSGSTALDSAAVRGVGRLRYAPARKHGVPVSTAFLQTVQFRRAGPGAVSTPPSPAAPSPPRPDSTPTRPRAARAAPDTVKARRDAEKPPADTTAAPPVAKPATDSAAPDSSRARPDSNGATR